MLFRRNNGLYGSYTAPIKSGHMVAEDMAQKYPPVPQYTKAAFNQKDPVPSVDAAVLALVSKCVDKMNREPTFKQDATYYQGISSEQQCVL
eukprot:gene31271-6415_t